MANLAVKNGIWLVRFRFVGKEFKRSLKTSSRRDAEAAHRAVEWTIHRLSTGQLQLRHDVDAGDFIVSGGLLQKPLRNAAPVIFPSTKSLIDRYLERCRHTAAPSYHDSQDLHLRHLSKYLGTLVERPCDFITQQVIEQHLLRRLRTRNPATVQREKTTITHFFRWVASRSDVPAFPCPAVGLPIFKGSVDRAPFRTIGEIEDILQRGGLTEAERLALWECLYLSPEEIADSLATVRDRSRDPRSFLLHAVPAYTGMRRGEALRLRWIDIDFAHCYPQQIANRESHGPQYTRPSASDQKHVAARLVCRLD